MAMEVSKMFLSDYGVGITGYESVVPECEEEGIFAFFSLCYKGEVIKNGRVTCTEKHPHKVQVDYTKQVIEEFYQVLVAKAK